MSYNADGTVSASYSPFKGGGASATATNLASGGYANPVMNSLISTVQQAGKNVANAMNAPKPVAPATTPAQQGVNWDALSGMYSQDKLKSAQQAFIKQTNPELYGKIYGESPTEVSAGELGTGGLTVTEGDTGSVVGQTTDAVVSNAVSTLSAGQVDETTMRPQDIVTSELAKMLMDEQTYSADVLAKQKEEADAKFQADQLNTMMVDYANQTKNELYRMRQNPEGKSWGANQASMANYEYDRYNRPDGLADMAIAASYAQGRYEWASKVAQDAVNAEDKMYQRRFDGLKTLYTLLQDDLSESERLQFESQLRMGEYVTQSYMESKNEALRIAGVNKAPAEVLQAIKNARTTDEVWLAAGQYGIDPDLAWQKSKFAMEYDLAVRKYNLDAAVKAGTISAETAEKQNAQILADRKYQQMQDAITAINENQLGFDVATGKVRGALLSSLPTALGTGAIGAVAGTYALPVVGTGAGAVAGFVGGLAQQYASNKQAQEDLAVQMNFITRNITTKALADARAQGVTFGALSDSEREELGGAGDVLANAWDAESMTFKGSPEKVATAIQDFNRIIAIDRARNAIGNDKTQAVQAQFSQ